MYSTLSVAFAPAGAKASAAWTAVVMTANVATKAKSRTFRTKLRMISSLRLSNKLHSPLTFYRTSL
jgi:hypothetical protein